MSGALLQANIKCRAIWVYSLQATWQQPTSHKNFSEIKPYFCNKIDHFGPS
uniref:Uncharacterized protein n=1 Tax=Rhizophora mucronata TaxID=61149 RepID=A0A2P2PIZ2_RHIMU